MCSVECQQTSNFGLLTGPGRMTLLKLRLYHSHTVERAPPLRCVVPRYHLGSVVSLCSWETRVLMGGIY